MEKVKHIFFHPM